MPLIDCLMGTYGRTALASEALACFLAQTKIDSATLMIYNQHPVPLKFDHPRVRVVNEVPPKGSLRFIRKRMLELSNPHADLVHWWDDDDIYLPWHLEDCCSHIGNHVAWKPDRCWVQSHNGSFSIQGNMFEGAWAFDRNYLMAASIETHPTYTDHPVTLQTIESGKLATTDLGGLTSYIYRWETGTQHISQFGGNHPERRQRQVIERLRRKSRHSARDGALQPNDLRNYWLLFLSRIANKVTEKELSIIKYRLFGA